MTDAETIAQLRRDVDVLTGLVVGLVSAAEVRAQAAVRNYDAASGGGSQIMGAITLAELAMQQSQVLRLESLDQAQLNAETQLGYGTLLARLNDAVAPYALPTTSDLAQAA